MSTSSRSAMSTTSNSLEQRSSMRKLPFPASCSESLRRLYAQCVTFARKQPSPKEIEVVLEVIDEFVFSVAATGAAGSGGGGSGGAKGKQQQQALLQQNTGGALSSNPALQELQMLQVLIDFFSPPDAAGGGGSSPSAQPDLNVLYTVYFFLFMEPGKKSSSGATSSSSGGASKRIVVMSKLVSMAMGMRNKNLLYCAAVWMQQQQQQSLELARLLVDDYILLLPPSPPPKTSATTTTGAFDSLKSLPETSPLFTANFMSVLAELYYREDPRLQPPPRLLLELLVSWVSARPMLPFNAALTSTQTVLTPGVASASSQTPLLGLAKWTILSALFDHQPGDLFSTLHLSLLESFAEAKIRRKELRNEIIPIKRVSLLIQSLESAMKDDGGNVAERREKCLDRLGQFLQAASAAECLSGKPVEIISSLKMLPANKLIQMYVVNLAKM